MTARKDLRVVMVADDAVVMRAKEVAATVEFYGSIHRAAADLGYAASNVHRFLHRHGYSPKGRRWEGTP